MLTIVIVLALIFVGYLVSVYNFFQTAKTRIEASIQEIANQLKRQADLIPNLEASVKGYLKHEKSILTMFSDARRAIGTASKSSDLGKQTAASSMLGDLVGRLAVVVESNPELKANTVVQNLMEELRDTADKVMYARRTLIDLTADYNTKRVTFPSNLIANALGVKPMEGLKVGDMSEATSVTSAELKSQRVSL